MRENHYSAGTHNWLPQELQARQANLRRGRAALSQQLERLTEAYLAAVIPLAEGPASSARR